jgi:hypothetical protein
MQRRRFVALSLMTAVATSNAMALRPKPSYGVVVRAEAAPGSQPKEGVRGFADSGAHLFGFGLLNTKQVDNSSYGGAGVPEWVRVTWRKDTTPGEYWTTGTVIGDYKIDVATRIPEDVSKYASQGKGRAIRLIFRIKDDGVALAWEVQESVKHPNGGSGQVFSLRGGDFPCDPVSPHASGPTCTSGYLKDAPWYNPQWIRD